MIRRLLEQFQDPVFIRRLDQFEGTISKVLSLGMIGVILAMVVDLALVVTKTIFTTPPDDFLGQPVIEIFGLFLGVLIALEILENITAYIKTHVVEVELVLATALTAVGRKFIILDLAKVSGVSLIGLAVAIFALAIGYWIVRTSHR
ncbi:MAG: phosphate-starvation-inducible PsiE family protein [Cyanobacteria bacterium REEB459]|nr:phosphate-starvation-inducible PsiE family protein [Cyanobacteria bacterium REEB459]